MTLYQGLGNDDAATMQVALAWLALRQGALAEAAQRSLTCLGAVAQSRAVEALGTLAGLAAARGRLVRAACLLGALHTLRSPLPDVDHAWADLDLPRLLETVRAELDATAFAAAWAAGAGLSWARARAFARAGADLPEGAELGPAPKTGEAIP